MFGGVEEKTQDMGRVSDEILKSTRALNALKGKEATSFKQEKLNQ